MICSTKDDSDHDSPDAGVSQCSEMQITRALHALDLFRLRLG